MAPSAVATGFGSAVGAGAAATATVATTTAGAAAGAASTGAGAGAGFAATGAGVGAGDAATGVGSMGTVVTFVCVTKTLTFVPCCVLELKSSLASAARGRLGRGCPVQRR